MSYYTARDMSAGSRGRRTGPALLMFVLVVLALATLLGGCGGQQESGDEVEAVVLATVGDREITDVYYKEHLAKLEKGELPRHEDGTFKDTSQLEGKKAFLDVIISKELLYLKGLSLGYDQREVAQAAREFATNHHAGRLFEQTEVNDRAAEIPEEAVREFYKRVGEVKKCQYIMTYEREDAEKARAEFLQGTPWEEVGEKYHFKEFEDGQQTLTIPWGQYGRAFESLVFATEDGGVSEVFEGNQGYWLIHVIKTEFKDKPPFEDIELNILNTLYNRQLAENRRSFYDQVLTDHKYELNLETMRVCWEGLPEDEQILDPTTNEPRKREDLEPLQIRPKDMDLPFYAYVTEGELHRFTLGDYKSYFDRMSVFKRPKRAEGMLSLKAKIREMVLQPVMQDETKIRGYYEHPDVLAAADRQVEEVVVTELYREAVAYKEEISSDELQAYWNEHKDLFALPEGRSGGAVVCATEEVAQSARRDLVAGDDWAAVVKRWSTDDYLTGNDGMTGVKYANQVGRFNDILFSLELNEISQPIAVDGGYAVVQLLEIEPPQERELNEVSEIVGRRIKDERENEAFQTLLAEWRQEFPVVVYEDRLADLPSWEDLQPEPDTGEDAKGKIVRKN